VILYKSRERQRTLKTFVEKQSIKKQKLEGGKNGQVLKDYSSDIEEPFAINFEKEVS
jgi:hypothetical protein